MGEGKKEARGPGKSVFWGGGSSRNYHGLSPDIPSPKKRAVTPTPLRKKKRKQKRDEELEGGGGSQKKS